MSSISAMGPHFFHWKNKLWVRGGRSRLALSENIENYFFGAVNDWLIPSKPANLRDPYKIRFSIFLQYFFSALTGGVTKRGNATAERGNENSQHGNRKIPGFRAEGRRH